MTLTGLFRKFIPLIFGLVILSMTLLACSFRQPIVPTMDLPPEPVKPKIEFKTMVYQNEPIIYLKMGQGLALYEYLVRLDVQAHEYRYRIESMNKLMGK